MKAAVLGIDIAQHLFHVHGVTAPGPIVLRKKLSRPTLLSFLAQLEPCLIGIEAWGSAHYWARAIRTWGHDVRRIRPQCVTPSRKRNTHDPADAEAMCEAVSRPHRRFVPIKEVEQQEMQALHRPRELLIKQRTALCKRIRGL